MIYYCNLDFVLVDEVSHGLWNCIKISKYIFEFSVRRPKRSTQEQQIWAKIYEFIE